MAFLVRVLLMASFAVLPVYFLAGAEGLGKAGDGAALSQSGEAALERHIQERIPLSRVLTQLGLDLRLAGGQREQNGIFISEQGLMKNIDQPNELRIEENAEAIMRFARKLLEVSEEKKNTYLVIIPTAGGVLQQNLPTFATSWMVDQQRLIEEIYNQLSSIVRTVDAYSALFARREEYIYYRTDNRMTPLGGYAAYTAATRRLGNAGRPLSVFDIEYVDDAYYGDLYQPPEESGADGDNVVAPYRRVAPDVLMLYRFSGNREYRMTQQTDGVSKVYHTMYPEHLMELGAPLDIHLGAPAAITHIQSSIPYSERLLVFGDEMAKEMIPFFTCHYQQVTFIDLNHAKEEDLRTVLPEDYTHVLFAYGIETFSQTTQPQSIRRSPWLTEEKKPDA